MTSKFSNFLLFACIALFGLILSQAIGYWVNNSLARGETWEMTALLHITHVRNFGGVFGMAQGMGWLFGLISIGLLGGVVVYLWLSSEARRIEYVCFGLVVAGGSSNILDRLLYGSVIDYLDVQHIPYWNYVFNSADVMIHAGIWPLLLFSLFDRGEAHNEPG